MKRRDFLIQAGAGALAIPRAVAAKGPSIAFPTEPRARLAVASYPFRDEIQSPKHPGNKMPLAAFPGMVVKRFKVTRIEPLSEHFPSTEPKYLSEFNAALKAAGASVVNIPVSPKGSLYDPNEAQRLAAVADAMRWVDVAVALRSPSVRIHIEGVHDVKPNVGLAVKSLKAIAVYGHQRNVVVNLENDDPISEDAFFIVQIIKEAADPYLRALPDFCNSMLIGNGERNYEAVRAMFQHAYNISHVKDSEADGGKIYRVDVDRTFQIAKASGYRGFFSMEWEGGSDPYAGTQKLIDMSLKNL